MLNIKFFIWVLKGQNRQFCENVVEVESIRFFYFLVMKLDYTLKRL
jgi:hypothetical protein